MKTAVRFTPKDNVAVLLCDLPKNAQVTIGALSVTAAEDIPYGHKMALCALAQGDTVVKYGEAVARCTADIPVGAWVHVHNVESIRGLGR